MSFLIYFFIRRLYFLNIFINLLNNNWLNKKSMLIILHIFSKNNHVMIQDI